MKHTKIVKQLLAIKKLAQDNMDKSPAHFKMLVTEIDIKLNDIVLDELAQLEADEIERLTHDSDDFDLKGVFLYEIV